MLAKLFRWINPCWIYMFLEENTRFILNIYVMPKAVRGRKYPRPKRFKGVFFAAYTLYNSTNFVTKSRIDCFWCVFPGAADPNQAYTDPNTQTAAPPQQTNQPAQQPGISTWSLCFLEELRSLLSRVSNTCFSSSSIWSHRFCFALHGSFFNHFV